MKDLTMGDALRALEEAFTESPEWNQVEHVVTRQEYERRAAATKRERVSTQAEEAEYREFATLLGITDDEPPVRMVTMPQAEYDKLKAESDKLPALLDEMRTRPEKISDAEEREYEAFLSLIGPM